jgi:hypothetical protein
MVDAQNRYRLLIRCYIFQHKKQADLLSKDIFEIVHEEDHTLFRTCLSSLPNSNSFGNSKNWSNLALMQSSNKDAANNVALEMAGVGAATASLSLSNDSPSTSAGIPTQQQPRSRFFAARFRRRTRTRRRDETGAETDNSKDTEAEETENADLSNDPRHECIAATDKDVEMIDPSLCETTMDDKIDPKRPVRTLAFERLLVSATWSMFPKITSQSAPSGSREWTLFCFARRMPISDFSPNSIFIDHFSMRLHPNGTIIAIDLSGLPDYYLQYFGKELIGTKWRDLTFPNDWPKWDLHMSKMVPNCDALTSSVYKVRPIAGVQLYVQTKSKRVGSDENEFVMCNHLIIKNQCFGERIYSGTSSIGNETSQTPPPSLSSSENMCSTSLTGCASTPAFPTTFRSGNCVGSSELKSTGSASNSELVSTSNSNAVQQISTGLFEELSPNAQQNQPDYNLNECLGLNEIFPSSNWPDYDASISSMDVNSVASRETPKTNSTEMNSNPIAIDDNKTEKAQKLRNLLTQKSEPGSPSDRKTDEVSKAMLDSQLAELTSNRNTLSSSAIEPQSPNSKRTGSPNSASTEKQRSNDILRELLHQEDDDEVMFSENQSDSVQRNFTCDPLANMETNSELNAAVGASGSSNKSTGSTSCTNQSGSSAVQSLSTVNSMSSTSSASKTNGNNMLRKLLNDDDNGKGFRKGQDILIEQLLKENQSPSAASDSMIDNPKPVGQLKRKSTEDHFTGNANNSSSNASSNASVGSMLSHSIVSQPNSSSSDTYQPIKRLSLSEPVKCSAPSPVQARQSAPIMTPLSTMNVNSTTITSGFRNTPINSSPTANVITAGSVHQPQQLAGQNPMLAQMLAQTPKTLPLPTISIPTSIVSQVPQERLPKNLEKKLIHTPTTTSHGASSTTMSTSQAALAFGMNGAISSQSNHVPPSPLIQTSPIMVTSQLAPSGAASYGIMNSIGGVPTSGHSQQFVMTSGGQLQPVKSIIVQTSAHPSGIEMSGQQIVQTQGNFLNKMYISNSAPQPTVPKSSVQMSGGAAPVPGLMATTQIISSAGHPMVGAGPPNVNFYSKQAGSIVSGSAANLAPSFMNNRVAVGTLNAQRAIPMDDNNDPLLSDILEQVCCMEQEMNIDSVPGDLATSRKYFFDGFKRN